ncbi:MAG: OsmC family protein [Balneolales bacterium]
MSKSLKKAEQEHIANAVGAVINQMKDNPETANVVFKADSTLSKGLQADVSIRQFKLVSDEPKSLGGTDMGPNPVELILGAFAACQEIVIAAYASVLGIPLEQVKVTAEGEVDLRGFFNVSDKVRPGFKNITFNTEITTSEEDPEKLEQIKFFALNRCPVLDILENPVPTEGTITFEPVTSEVSA